MTETRQTFSIPQGFEAEHDDDGRATGNLVRRSDGVRYHHSDPHIQGLVNMEAKAAMDFAQSRAEGMEPVRATEYGEHAFDAYCEQAQGKAHDGRPIPNWADLPQTTRDNWANVERRLFARWLDGTGNVSLDDHLRGHGRVRHKVRGGTYRVLGPARLQVNSVPFLSDNDLLMVYQSEAGGALVARYHPDFIDGRFEELGE